MGHLLAIRILGAHKGGYITDVHIRTLMAITGYCAQFEILYRHESHRGIDAYVLVSLFLTGVGDHR